MFKRKQRKPASRTRKREVPLPPDLTRQQKREVRAVLERARRDDGIPRTAQQSIPFERMFPDGICRVSPRYYSKTIQFWDVNYQLAQQEDQTALFDEWCSFLNFFDASIHFQFSFVNSSTDPDAFARSIRIPPRNDGFNDVRAEYSAMLRSQLAQGNNGLTKTKYLTFGIEAENLKSAKPRLEHIQTDILNNLHKLGVAAKPLGGKERLHLMHDLFHMGDRERFQFEWDWLPAMGLSVKDFIAPSSFAFPGARSFQMGALHGAMSFLFITASDLSDQVLKEFLDMDSTQVISMHIQSVDQTEAIKMIKHTITELDRSKIEEQKKAVRAGYDMDILPSDLATYGNDAKALLKELQSQNERMFLLTFLVMNTGKDAQELENNVFQAVSIAQKHNCALKRLDYQQEDGLMSCLPLASNLIEIQRNMTTSSTAIFIPFTTQELFQEGKESLYYGLNALSNNLIMVDRKKLKNPNGLILGTSGSGKPFSAKREIANAFLVTDDDIIVADPESEYSPLVLRLGGQVIKISPNSTQYINPMDINDCYSEEDNPVALKSDFILSLCELIVGGKEGLQAIEKTVIDRCVHQIYQRYFEHPTPENMPILEDLYHALLAQEEKEAHHVATALEIYVKGSLNLFNHRTNVDINPYELISYLTVRFEDFHRDQVQDALQQVFSAQYELSTVESVEMRTRTVTETGPETGEETTREKEYEYHILTVTLRNHGIAAALNYAGFTESQIQRYRMLIETKGNKPYLFEDDIYANEDYLDYDIPGEALTDERFANMIHEAEKYLGYPYVWGGSSPSTSFDCSGFVCWVINHCGNGWNYGRLDAETLRRQLSIIPASAAKPGDIIFFQGTYDTYGASHVGIYVGGGMMIHCGSPISYANINTSYWQAHFYCYGRLP